MEQLHLVLLKVGSKERSGDWVGSVTQPEIVAPILQGYF